MFTMLLESSADAAQQAGTSSLLMTGVMLLFWIGIMYLVLFRPQKKQQKELDAMRDSLQAGDNIMTTGGFYGVVLDVTEDGTVIVEFGNDRHCRIPMNKNAILEVERYEEEDAKE